MKNSSTLRVQLIFKHGVCSDILKSHQEDQYSHVLTGLGNKSLHNNTTVFIQIEAPVAKTKF